MSDEDNPPDQHNKDDGDKSVAQFGTSALEWACAMVGAIIVAGIAGYLAYMGFTETDAPPVLIIEQAERSRNATGYLVATKVRNQGARPALTVRIAGELFEGGRLIQRSTVDIDSIPQRSERSLGLQFTEDPARYRLILRVEGFSDP